MKQLPLEGFGMDDDEEIRINPAGQVHGREEIEAIIEVAESGHWAEGKKAEEFRQGLKEFFGVRHVVLTNSGSSANLAALLALTTQYVPEDRRIKTGDEVITTALCFPTTVSPIRYAGAVPVFVDVEPDTWNIDADQIEKMITPYTKAIMVAHALGNPFNVDKVIEICEKYNLTLIEDNCDSTGSEWRGRKTGTIGHIGTSSFYPAHHISTGEGGAVYTNNSQIFRGIRSMVNWGRDCWCPPGEDDTCNKRYDWQMGDLPHGYDHKNTYSELGFNLKMTDLSAAIGVEQLKRLPMFIEKRKYNHARIKQVFEFINAQYEWFDLPKVHEGADPSWFGYVIKVKEDAPFTRDEFANYLDEKGIRSRAFFCGNITKQPAFYGREDAQYRSTESLEVSDSVMDNAFWIGVHPALTEENLEYMQEQILNFVSPFTCEF